MGMKHYLVVLRKRIDVSPELKMKIMWFLDKVPALKNGLKKIGDNKEEPETNTYEALSPNAKEIYNTIKSKMGQEI